MNGEGVFLFTDQSMGKTGKVFLAVADDADDWDAGPSFDDPRVRPFRLTCALVQTAIDHDPRYRQFALVEGHDGQERVIDGPEAGPRNDEDRQAQEFGEVEETPSCRQRHQDPPRPFDDHELVSTFQFPERCNKPAHIYRHLLMNRRDRRREGRSKTVGIHKVKWIFHSCRTHERESVVRHEIDAPNGAACLGWFHHAYIDALHA